MALNVDAIPAAITVFAAVYCGAKVNKHVVSYFRDNGGRMPVARAAGYAVAFVVLIVAAKVLFFKDSTHIQLF